MYTGSKINDTLKDILHHFGLALMIQYHEIMDESLKLPEDERGDYISDKINELIQEYL